MGIYIALVTIKTGSEPEDTYPPGHPISLSDEDAAGLKGYVRDLNEQERAALSGIADVPEVVPLDGDDDTKDGDEGDEGDEGDSGSGPSRVEQVRAAIELLDPENDFVKTGARAGKPKIDALSDALGFKPDDVEIDAALALNSEGA